MVKRWTIEEKLAIIKEAQVIGVTQASRKHNIHHSTVYDWIKQYTANGQEGLKSSHSVRVEPELKQLRQENARLKKIVAEKELALEIKGELLKKTLQRQQIKE